MGRGKLAVTLFVFLTAGCGGKRASPARRATAGRRLLRRSARRGPWGGPRRIAAPSARRTRARASRACAAGGRRSPTRSRRAPTTTASWASRPAVAPLDPARPDVGVALTAGTRVASAIFSDDPAGAASASGLDLAGLAGVVEADAGTPTRVLLVQATSPSRDGAVVASQDGTASMLEADGLSGAELRLTGDMLGKATIHAPTATRVTWYGEDVPFTRSGDYVLVDTAPMPAPDPPPTSTLPPTPTPPPTSTPPSSSTPPPATPARRSVGVTADLVALFAAAALPWRRRR